MVTIIVTTGCAMPELKQAYNYRIANFIADRSVNKVVFTVSFQGDTKPVDGEYIFSLIVDNKVVDSSKYVVKGGEGSHGALKLAAQGPTMFKMLMDLEQKYIEAQSQYNDFEKRIAWDFARGDWRSKSYDEVKRLQDEETKLKIAMIQFDGARKGEGYPLDTPVQDYLKKYVSVRIQRSTSTPTVSDPATPLFSPLSTFPPTPKATPSPKATPTPKATPSPKATPTPKASPTPTPTS